MSILSWLKWQWIRIKHRLWPEPIKPCQCTTGDRSSLEFIVFHKKVGFVQCKSCYRRLSPVEAVKVLMEVLPSDTTRRPATAFDVLCGIQIV